MGNKLIAGLIALVIACTSCSKAIIKPSDQERDICFDSLFETKRIAIQKKDWGMISKLRQDRWCNDYDMMGEDIEILEHYIKSSYKK